MDWQQELKRIEIIRKVAEEIQMIGQTYDHIDGVSKHARNAKFELLKIIDLFKEHNREKEENGKEEVIQYKNKR
jgi:hypothetical protein